MYNTIKKELFLSQMYTPLSSQGRRQTNLVVADIFFKTLFFFNLCNKTVFTVQGTPGQKVVEMSATISFFGKPCLAQYNTVDSYLYGSRDFNLFSLTYYYIRCIIVRQLFVLGFVRYHMYNFRFSQSKDFKIFPLTKTLDNSL